MASLRSPTMSPRLPMGGHRRALLRGRLVPTRSSPAGIHAPGDFVLETVCEYEQFVAGCGSLGGAVGVSGRGDVHEKFPPPVGGYCGEQLGEGSSDRRGFAPEFLQPYRRERLAFPHRWRGAAPGALAAG